MIKFYMSYIVHVLRVRVRCSHAKCRRKNNRGCFAAQPVWQGLLAGNAHFFHVQFQLIFYFLAIIQIPRRAVRRSLFFATGYFAKHDFSNEKRQLFHNTAASFIQIMIFSIKYTDRYFEYRNLRNFKWKNSRSAHSSRRQPYKLWLQCDSLFLDILKGYRCIKMTNLF